MRMSKTHGSGPGLGGLWGEKGNLLMKEMESWGTCTRSVCPLQILSHIVYFPTYKINQFKNLHQLDAVAQNAGNCIFYLQFFKISRGWPPGPPQREGALPPPAPTPYSPLRGSFGPLRGPRISFRDFTQKAISCMAN